MNLRAVLFMAPMVVAPLESEPMVKHLDFVDGRTVVMAAAQYHEPAPLEQIVVPPEEEAPAELLSKHVDYPPSAFDLDTVKWTVDQTAEVRDIAEWWGMRSKHLRYLNPHLGSGPVEAGTELVVFRKIASKPSCSVGAPNTGWLRTGTALPEGDHWKLRPRRAATFGSKHTIEGLLMALEAYGAQFPDGPEIRIGDLSRRSGRQLDPHASHRTGRDVDIGYILDPAKRVDRFWQSADEKNLDVEKTWFFVKALIETGRVQQMYVSGKLQRLLMKEARKELSKDEMARYFRRANPDPNSPSVITHWRGHRDHMHVRFECADYERLCVSQSAQP